MSKSITDNGTDFNFEKALALLQDNVKKLESGELELEQSLKTFEEGIKLIRTCQNYLTEAEKRVEILTKVDLNSDSPIQTQPFKA